MSQDPSTPQCLPPYLQREAVRQLPAIHAIVERVVRSGCFLFGDELLGFERELAAAVGTAHARGTGSGTDAIELALRALGIGPGDRVVTQSHSSPFTVIGIWATGARPVLVEASDRDFGMDLDALERAVRQGARAIVPVHLYGQPLRIEEICAIAAAAGVPVVEDCAQAQGASVGGRQVGSFGRAGCMSFYPTKNLGSLGDGGAVVTDDAQLAERVASLRNGGMRAPGLHRELGVTSRLSELQAALLRLRLRELPAGNAARRRHARMYAETLRFVRTPQPRSDCEWAPHQYVIRHPQRQALRTAAAARGMPLSVHYPLPIHLQDGFRMPEHPPGSLPVAEAIAREVLSLPTHPELTDAERQQLVDCINIAAAALEQQCPTATS